MALKKDGTVWVWGFNEYGRLGDGTSVHQYKPVPALGLKNIAHIEAYPAINETVFCGYAVKKDGTVWHIGKSTEQIKEIDNVVQIEIGRAHV